MVSENPSTVSQLSGLLSWSRSNESDIAHFNGYQRRLFLAWGSSLIKILRVNSDLGRSLTVKARALPQDAFRRFLTAPAVVYRLEEVVSGECAPETMRFLASALDAEYYRLTNKGELECTVWTALGDFMSSSDAAEAFQAPLAAGYIPVDFKSPFVKGGDMDRFYGPYADFTSREIQTILDSLDEAVDGISQSNHKVMEFIKLFTRVIVARKNVARPDQVGSRSFSRYIGATIIENPHNGIAEAVTLAESLVHEAIHHLLYSEELQRPFVSQIDVAKDFRAVSPWTGRVLNMRQYLHACAVWFGLWRFWSLCIDSTVFPQPKVRSSIQRAAQGFRQGSLLDNLSQVLRFVSPELQDAVSSMQTVVLGEAL